MTSYGDFVGVTKLLTSSSDILLRCQSDSMRVAVHECFFQSCQPANLAQVLATDCTMLQRVIKAFLSSAESSITTHAQDGRCYTMAMLCRSYLDPMLS